MPTVSVREQALGLARSIAAGHVPEAAQLQFVATLRDEHVESLFPGLRLLCETVAPQGVHLCTICNVKSGLCTEDCRFCAQARGSSAEILTYPLLDVPRMQRLLDDNSKPPLARCSLVSAGRRASAREVTTIVEALAASPEGAPHFCASLGLLGEVDLRRLAEAGLTRYHCNLETARSHFSSVVGTHSYEDKLATIAAARRAGLSLCVGGLFGIGETDDQLLELVLTLRSIRPDAIPVNFLVRVPGTPFASLTDLSPARCLKIVALLRFALPRKDILICGGRAQLLRDWQPQLFAAGASGIMTGNYLTTSGCALEDDLALLRRLGRSPRRQPP
ncbi:biotin synthase BioB [Myxococcota bacterium]